MEPSNEALIEVSYRDMIPQTIRLCNRLVCLLGLNCRYQEHALTIRSQRRFVPPAVLLVTSDPYLSIWSMADPLYDVWPLDSRQYKRRLLGNVCPQPVAQDLPVPDA